MAVNTVCFKYEKDPEVIYKQSFTMIDDFLVESNLSDDMMPVAKRLVHACGMPDVLDFLFYSNRAGDIGRDALRSGAPILCDAEMISYFGNTAQNV